VFFGVGNWLVVELLWVANMVFCDVVLFLLLLFCFLLSLVDFVPVYLLLKV